MGRDKEQRIGTPAELCPYVYRFFDDEPDLDPFGMPGQVVRAKRIVLLPEHGRARKPFVRGDAWRIAWSLGGGGGTVYGNPPFEELERAFKKALETSRCHGEVLLLVPLRSHRAYWELAWRAQAICYLKKPVAFLGYKDALSMPCVVLYFGPHQVRRGPKGDIVDARQRFEDVFGELGRCERLTAWPGDARMVAMGDMQKIINRHAAKAFAEVVAANPDKTLHEIADLWEDFAGNALFSNKGNNKGAPDDFVWNTPVRELFGGLTGLDAAKGRVAAGMRNGAAKFVGVQARSAAQKAATKRAKAKAAKKKASKKASAKKAPKKSARKKAPAKAKVIDGRAVAAPAAKAKKAGAGVMPKTVGGTEPAAHLHGDAAVVHFVNGKKAGTKFTTQDFIAATGKSGQTARKWLHNSKKVVKVGDKRAAAWEVVA
jgi:hypothetical protein